MQDMKIHIRDEEQSKRVQEALFKIGGCWACGSQAVMYEDNAWLFVSNKRITRTASEEYGLTHNWAEYFLSAMDEFLPVIEFEKEEDKPIMFSDIKAKVIFEMNQEVEKVCREIIRKIVQEELQKTIQKLL